MGTRCRSRARSRYPGKLAALGCQRRCTFCATLAQHASRNRKGSGQWLRPRIVSRSEEHTSELQSLMRISYDVFCLNKTTTYKTHIANLTIYNYLQISTQHHN